MATWIVHLRIAEALLARRPELDAGQFAIGNVAPDSGLPDEKWENFTPPPAVTHFHTDQPNWRWRVEDLRFYRAYLQQLDPAREPDVYAFHLGYFTHLLTDNLWWAEIGAPTSQKWAAEFAADKDFIWTVKEDWYGLDFVYVRQHPECLYWRDFLHAPPPASRLDFLPLSNIQYQLKYIQDYYQKDGQEVHQAFTRPYIYLAQPEVDAFVARAVERCARAWQALTDPAAALDGRSTALELLPEYQ